MNQFCKTKALILAGFFSLLSPGLHAQWTQLGSDIDGEANDDQFGYSVSFSADGTIFAAGAPIYDGGGVQRGQARVFKRNDGTWTQLGSSFIGTEDLDWLGYAVSLSGDGTTVAIGVPRIGVGNARGMVQVYKWSGGAWIQQGTDILGEEDNDQFGSTLSISADGNTVAIGAPTNTGGGIDRGHVRVFKMTGGAWIQQGTDIDGEANSDQSGFSVSLAADGNSLAVGSYLNTGGGIFRGHVRVFKKIGGAWIQKGTDIDGEANNDLSGYAVSLSVDGSYLAIGAPINAGGGISRGHVRVYKWTGGAWTQLGADIDGEANSDQSGYSVSLSADGFALAIGAYNNGGGGSARGHVRVYKWIGSAWTQQGADIDGEADIDLSGWSSSISADGTRVAIGAPTNNAGGTDRGQVRVYSYCSQSQQFLNAILALAKQKGKKVYVCHRGITNLQVSANELYFHLFHGDKLGKCEVSYCEGLELRGNDLEQYIGTEVDKTSDESIILYPNPAGHILNVKWPFHTEQSIQIQIINSLGQTMINQPVYLNGKDHGTFPINIQKLPQGIYVLKATGEGYEESRPFTKF